jgi:hypothetical protein
MNWASDINDRKLTSGYTFKLADAAMSWSSKKQTSIALSSMEAEYISRAHAAKEAVWLRQLLSELSIDTSSPTILHVNNQFTITITKNPELHDHTMHINIVTAGPEIALVAGLVQRVAGGDAPKEEES